MDGEDKKRSMFAVLAITWLREFFRIFLSRAIARRDVVRTISIEEVRNVIPAWLSEFESQKPR